MAKLPAFQFYPGDWLKDPNLRRCSHAAKGVWMDLLCLMFESEERGILSTWNVPWSDAEIAQAVGGDRAEVIACMKELTLKGVASRTEQGALFSRRLVRDEKKRAANQAAGKSGGNPNLCEKYNETGFVYALRRKSDNAVKIGIALNVENRVRKIRYAHKGDVLTLMGVVQTQDMGATEKEIHAHWQEYCIGGEWFAIPDDVADPLNIAPLKGTAKGQDKGADKGQMNGDAKGQEERPPVIPARAARYDGLSAPSSLGDWKEKLRANADFVDAWTRWKTHLLDPEINKTMSHSQEDAVLMEIARHGADKAVAVIAFSILKGAKNLIWDAPIKPGGKVKADPVEDPPFWKRWLSDHYPDHEGMRYADAPDSVTVEFRQRRK